MTLTQTAPKPAATIKIWEDTSAETQVGDIIRKPFCPIARVVGKEILADGCTCLIVFFPGCLDHHSEEWILEAPATPATVAITATGTGTNNGDEPPNRGDNGRGRVQPAKKSQDRNSAQLAIIREELAAIGIKLGKLISSREDIKGWFVRWDGAPAALYWSSGNGWEIGTRKGQAELAGNWEGFDLMEHLDSNGIEFPE